jgi:hypothetical protein
MLTRKENNSQAMVAATPQGGTVCDVGIWSVGKLMPQEIRATPNGPISLR